MGPIKTGAHAQSAQQIRQTALGPSLYHAASIVESLLTKPTCSLQSLAATSLLYSGRCPQCDNVKQAVKPAIKTLSLTCHPVLLLQLDNRIRVSLAQLPKQANP